MAKADKPVVVITGAAGRIGSRLAARLSDRYTVVGLDQIEADTVDDSLHFDLTSDESVELAFRKIRDRHGAGLASVVHLAAYFDFTGEDSPLYETVNVEGTRRVLRQLRDFDVEQFVYSGTMLVHGPGRPGERIDEDTAIDPQWAYPESKAKTEAVIRDESGEVPYVLLHLAGLYDDRTAVPTLSHQIARVYERSIKAHLYAGNMHAGQAMLHLDDMLDAFERVIDRRADLDDNPTFLIGEPEAISYGALQQTLARLIHDEEDWRTLTVPEPVAKLGARVEAASEPIVPDVIDQGEKPFIRAFMIDLADDHYALDISRARDRLGWTPEHRLEDALPDLVAALKDDPHGWYEANGITPPRWIQAANETDENPHELLTGHRAAFRRQHAKGLWAHFLNIGLGTWLITGPLTFGYEMGGLFWSDLVSGAVLIGLSVLALDARFALVRWAIALVGVWLMFAPLVFWTPSAAGYLNGTLVGALVIALSVVVRPAPGVSAVAARTGPTVPPGWEFNPSSWSQRAPIILLAFVGFHISHYMAAYQLGHIDAVWDPFFAGTVPKKNGTEDIITSEVSEAWPVPDAGLGALTYMLEILTGLMGSSRRWRTMPWLVFLFGLMIVPLGAVSIVFIVIQPIVIGTWCTLCLIAAAAMLIQIPYSFDELVATGQFLARRKRAGRSLIRVFLVGDTDEVDEEAERAAEPADFEIRRAGDVVVGMWTGGVGLPWNLVLCVAIGIWLMFTRATLGTDGTMANADHLIGALVVTIAVIALAHTARSVRLLILPCGIALAAMPLLVEAGTAATVSAVVCGVALVLLSLPRGDVSIRYGNWNRLLV